MELNSVVLPEPLGPISPVIRPSGTDIEMSGWPGRRRRTWRRSDLDLRSSIPSASRGGFRRRFLGRRPTSSTSMPNHSGQLLLRPAQDALLEVDTTLMMMRSAERDPLPAQQVGPGRPP